MNRIMLAARPAASFSFATEATSAASTTDSDACIVEHLNARRIRPAMIPQNGRVVLVMLKDGRQIEGELLVLTGRFAIGDVVFEAWEIETLEDVA
jgi:hypothetical protein